MQAYDSRLFSELTQFQGHWRSIGGALVVAMIGMVLLVGGHSAASAQDVVLGKFKDWTAHSYQEPDSKVCNIWSRPIDKKPANVRRGDVYAFVTHRPGVNSRSAVSFQMGYPLRAGKPVSVQIGGKKFSLSIEGEAAFADAKDDPALAQAMKRGNRMIVRGVSTRGTRTTDTYSLSGMTAATKAIDGACPG